MVSSHVSNNVGIFEFDEKLRSQVHTVFLVKCMFEDSEVMGKLSIITRRE